MYFKLTEALITWISGSAMCVCVSQGIQSILRKPKGSGAKGQRARLSPLVLLLDGALVGELETVQRAMQEVSTHKPPTHHKKCIIT